MNVSDSLVWENVNDIFQSHGVPINVVPLIKWNPYSFGDSFEVEILLLDKPCWVLTFETGTWIRNSSSKDVDARELIWPEEINTRTLALHISLETMWEIHIWDSPLTEKSWQQLEEQFGAIVREYWQLEALDSFHAAHSTIATWNEYVSEYGFDNAAPTKECIEHFSKPVEEELTYQSAPFRHIPVIATIEDQLVGIEADEKVWKSVRRQSVSATDARFLIKRNGEPRQGVTTLLNEKINEIETPFLQAFARGIEREPIIAAQISEWFEELRLTHNRFLFVGQNFRHVATPDMVGNGVLCEIKVLSKSLKSARSQYFDQMQWQMHVLGAERVLFAVENRFTEEIELEWIERDDDRINALVSAADQFLEALDREGGQPKLFIEGTNLDYSILDEAIENDAEYVSEKLLAGLIEYNEIDESSDVETSDEEEVEVTLLDQVQKQKPKFKKWNRKTRTNLLWLYLSGASSYVIAEQMGIEPAEAVSELSRLVLGAKGKLVDESAPRFGTTWTPSDHDALTLHYRMGLSLERVAAAIGRDQLGAAFVIFSKHSPPVPKKVIKKYSLQVVPNEVPSLPKSDASTGQDFEYSTSRKVKFLDFGVGDQVKVFGAGLRGETGIVRKIDFEDDTALVEMNDSSNQYWFSFSELEGG